MGFGPSCFTGLHQQPRGPGPNFSICHSILLDLLFLFISPKVVGQVVDVIGVSQDSHGLITKSDDQVIGVAVGIGQQIKNVVYSHYVFLSFRLYADIEHQGDCLVQIKPPDEESPDVNKLPSYPFVSPPEKVHPVKNAFLMVLVYSILPAGVFGWILGFVSCFT